MLRKTISYLGLAIVALAGISVGNGETKASGTSSDGRTGKVERMLVTQGQVTLDLERPGSGKHQAYRLKVDPNSFFTIRVINDEFRSAHPGVLRLISENAAQLSEEPLRLLSNQLVLEKLRSGASFDLLLRDGQTGFVYFNIEGQHYEYDSATKALTIIGGKLLFSEELANKLGRPSDARKIAGKISLAATVTPIEITNVVNGQEQSSTLPARHGHDGIARSTVVPGPDIVVGDMSGLEQFGSSGSQVGLGIGTTSCNNGDQEVHFYQLPNPDHSVVSQNLYRMSGGPNNSDRFEQIGQAWVKHTFGANQDDDCGFGCTPAPTFSTLGVGCSDPYASFQNASQTDHAGALGSRAWVNPFTGAFPTSPRPENHSGHTHTGTSHRILVEASDLEPANNPGATYYTEVQYDSPHEYAWCMEHPGQCNMYNNASYRRYNVAGSGSFTFESVGYTSIMTPATAVWTGAMSSKIEPEPGVDGRAFVVYKITNPSAGVWHYEYAIHNQNLDRSIQSFSVPVGAGASISSIGFHAPPNHPGFPNDGTVNNAGFSNSPWNASQTGDSVNWNTETLAQNPNANAIRFATMYNFRFDSNRPPQPATATIGFFKTGSPITVAIHAPSPEGAATPSPTPVARAVNLSTRMRVQTGENVGIGGLIISGSTPKHVLIRAIGPSLASAGVPNILADPVLELHGPGGFTTITNNNWRDTQEAEIQATGIPPTDNLESAISATLNPGSYTAIVRGNNDTTGVALVEVYDLAPVAGKLANLSTRAFVSLGDNLVIAGFILGGTGGSNNIMIRGLGPSLASAGVTNPLLNPTLEVWDSNGASLAFSNNWLDNPAEAALIIEAGLQPSDEREAAIPISLAPGLYTAILAGLNSSTGVGVVELYDRGP